MAEEGAAATKAPALNSILAYASALAAAVGAAAATPWVLIPGLVAVLFFGVRVQLDSLLGIGRLRGLLGDRRYAFRWRIVNDTYHAKLRGALGRLDRSLTPASDPDAARAGRAGALPFGWPLFRLCLLLAYLYPIGLMALLWLGGGEGRIGATVGLPGDAPLWMRLLLGLALALLLAQWILKVILPGWLRLVIQLGAAILAIAVAGAFAGAGAVAGAGAFAFAFAVAVAGAVVGAVAGAVVGAVAAAVVGAGAGAFAAAVAVAVALSERRGIGGWGWAGLFLLCCAGFAFAAWWDGGRNDRLAELIVFLGVLPLVNGLFDWLSLGLTRWLLRRGAASGAPLAALYGLADLAAALGLFTLLGFALIAAVAGLGALAGRPVLDLGALFADLSRPEGWRENWWLIATIFSTFLPTVLHVLIASLSFVSAVPVAWGGRVRETLNAHGRGETDGTRRTLLALHVTGMLTLTILMPVALVGCVGAIVWQWAPDIGERYLCWFQDFASVLDVSVPSCAPPPP